MVGQFGGEYLAGSELLCVGDELSSKMAVLIKKSFSDRDCIAGNWLYTLLANSYTDSLCTAIHK